MFIETNKNLRSFNTFGLEQYCNVFYGIEDSEELKNLDLRDNFIVLGSGSNIILTKPIEKVIKFYTESIKVTKKTSSEVNLSVDAGVEWDYLVKYCVENKYWGLENLSGIPGTVGAAPVQNIGAYGVEVKEVIDSVEVFNTETENFEYFTNEQCDFKYRYSIFKNFPKKYIITKVNFKLSLKPRPRLDYKDLKILSQTEDINAIRNYILEIRRNKLPDYRFIGNCGSFFKNVIVDKYQLEILQEKYPGIVYFENNGQYKIPTAWLIEKAGLKGYSNGKVAIYSKHAQIIINLGNASPEDVLEFKDFVIQKVYEHFEIKIEPEVIII